MVCFGFADSLWKIPVYAFGAARSVLYRNVFVIITVLPYFLLSEQKSYISIQAVWVTLGIGIIGYLGIFFFAKAVKYGMTSVVVPVSSLNTLVTLLISIFTFDAELNLIVISGVIVALVGLFLLKMNLVNGRFQFVFINESGIWYGLLAAICWGIGFAYSYYAVTFTGPALFTILQEITILVLALLHVLILQLFLRKSENPFKRGFGLFDPQKKVNGKAVISQAWKQNWLIYLLIGLFGGVGSIFNVRALDQASINTVSGLVVMAPIISVMFGQLYYGEKLTRQQKLAVFFIISGVFVVSYFRYY